MQSSSTINKPDGTSNDNPAGHGKVGSKDPETRGLAEIEKKFLIEKSRIGFGFNIADQGGPDYTNRQVVAETNIILPKIGFSYVALGERDVVVTRSSSTSAFLRAGWIHADLAVKTPWADVEVKASTSQSSTESQSQSRAYITGRYNFAHCALSMKINLNDLKPHADFKKDVLNALAITDEKKREKEVKRVFEWWGTMFVTSVELGGMKHSTIEKTLDEKTTEEDVKTKMSASLGTKFGPVGVDASGGGGTENNQSDKQKNEFESMDFDTVGGSIEAPTLAKWRESLSEPRNWGVTRVLGVGSTINLFDDETQLKIALAVFKTPLYLFRNKAGKHCLGTNKDPFELPPDSDGQRTWVLWGQLGKVLTARVDGAIPLYHLYDGNRHAFTCDWDERNWAIVNWGFRDLDVVGYVQPTKKPGTIPLSRMFNKESNDNTYDVSEKGIASATAAGYDLESQFSCYVYAA